MDFPIIIIWVSPLPFLGTSGLILIFIPYFYENPLSKRNVPDGMLLSAVSHLGLYCLPMSHKKDARLQ